jgi:hypothetical protein
MATAKNRAVAHLDETLDEAKCAAEVVRSVASIRTAMQRP